MPIKFGGQEGSWDECVKWAEKNGKKNPDRYCGALQARQERNPQGNQKRKRPVGRKAAMS